MKKQIVKNKIIHKVVKPQSSLLKNSFAIQQEQTEHRVCQGDLLIGLWNIRRNTQHNVMGVM